MNKRTAFLFDLDGVLIDSEQKYTEIWNEIEKKFPTGVENFARKIKGTTLDDILDKYFPDPDTRKKVHSLLWELENRMSYDYTPGAKQLLANLNEKNIPTALVTSSNQKKMDHLWSELPEMKSYFTVIIDGDMVSRSKPDPEGYVKGAEFCGADPADCVVFEDSLQGVKAGKAAGAFVVGVAGTLPAEVIAPFSDIVINSLEEITTEYLLKKIAII